MIAALRTVRGHVEKVPFGAPAPEVEVELDAGESVVSFEIHALPLRKNRTTVDWSWTATLCDLRLTDSGTA